MFRVPILFPFEQQTGDDKKGDAEMVKQQMGDAEMGEQQMGDDKKGEQQMGTKGWRLRGLQLEPAQGFTSSSGIIPPTPETTPAPKTTPETTPAPTPEKEPEQEPEKGEAGTKRKSDTGDDKNYGGTDDSSDSEVPNYDKSGAGGSKGDSKSATGSDSKGGSKSGTGSDSKGKGGSQGKGDFAARLAKARQDLAGCDEQTLRDIIMCHDDGSEAII
jgi:outer membrane biosynthesis protein TonB